MKKINPKGNSQNDSPKVNKKHKDSVFSSLFSNPDVLRELFSAIEGVPVPKDTPIEINTLSGVLYKGKINDISFLIDNRLVVLIEHQSTVNNNIPLRFLIYIAQVYKKIVNMKKMYRTKLEKIPFPEFIVLYNGKNRYPDYSELRLSDAFKGIENLKLADAVPLELTAHVYNINKGHNLEIQKKCQTLDNYSAFIDKIREGQKKGLTLEEAVNKAVKYCKENDILKKFLEAHSSEVYNMIFGEWIWDDAMEVAHEEGIEIGIEIGMKKGEEKGIEKGIVIGVSKTREEDRRYFLELLKQGLTTEKIEEQLKQLGDIT